MGQVFAFLGLTTGVIYPRPADEERREAYACDVTYATNNELGFDYLRDNMKRPARAMAQRGHNFAIVDEVDSILIDEARTPLIISGPLEDRPTSMSPSTSLIPQLEEEDFDARRKAAHRDLHRGRQRLSSRQAARDGGRPAGGQSLYDPENVTIVHHVTKALRPTSCSSATRTTSCATARWSSSTSSPAA
jgi:preprotein translocase subunit SecA